MFSNAKEVDDQLSSMQRKMINVKSSLGSIDVIKMKYIKEVATALISIYKSEKSPVYICSMPNSVISKLDLPSILA